MLGRFDDAHDQLNHALDLATQAGDQAGQAHTHRILSGGSSPACACRYAFTQLRRVCSFTPIPRAVDGIARDSSTTIRAICSLYSGVYDLRCLAITIPLSFQ
jgi:hypothetical protein